MIVAGNKIYDVCQKCGELVKINKFLFGSMHLCVSDEVSMQRHLLKEQEQACKSRNSPHLGNLGNPLDFASSEQAQFRMENENEID